MNKITEDMIGCLCEFSDLSSNHKELDILEDIELNINNYSYKQKYNGYWSPICRPVKPDEVKFYDYDDRYNCCSENEELRLKVAELEEENEELRIKIHILNEANMKLENENGRLATKYSQLKEENKELNDTFLKLDKASKDLEKSAKK